MELISIGEAARRLDLNASALRYYEERGLVRPAARHSGKRMYGQAELRRLALVALMQRLGVRLDTAAAVMDESGEQWRSMVRDQIVELEALIERAQGARKFLSEALTCPADHPTSECPHLVGVLDRLFTGGTFEELAEEHVGDQDNAVR
ncbi:MerR family transcriptional regulator [Nonomuraea phyllanthi]|uniref:MerR family transcriptional regulator n=2 Tax=Nonomuraea phyllanthi TaxID=2219224 RepID=UPI0012933E57|nr:MerR family transcriptional regulator [Nonomuraea phyllanthi]QFY13366.1 MerR family transcriptional regulator [Nonomuraea phyllanthi]